MMISCMVIKDLGWLCRKLRAICMTYAYVWLTTFIFAGYEMLEMVYCASSQPRYEYFIAYFMEWFVWRGELAWYMNQVDV